MILLANGCSWTWGGGLNLNEPSLNEERLNNVWPKHLGNLLNSEQVVNLAAGCGSNQRILRTTLNWILQQTPETLSKTVAIVQWTEWSRYEFYQPEDFQNHWENFSERWVLAKVGCIMDPYEHDADKAMKRLNARLETYTEIEGLYRSIFECAALENIFNKYSIPYYYWRYGGLASSYPVDLVDVLHSYNWFKDSEHWEYSRVSEHDRHPSLLGHKQIAQIIFDLIKDKK